VAIGGLPDGARTPGKIPWQCQIFLQVLLSLLPHSTVHTHKQKATTRKALQKLGANSHLNCSNTT